MMDAIEVIRPDPDSHFRLVPCKACRSDQVVYEQYLAGEKFPWRVRCQGCGCMVDKGMEIRHEAQVAWNKENSNVKTESVWIV